MDLLHKCGSQSYRSVVSRSVEAVSHDLLTDPERCTDEIGVLPPALERAGHWYCIPIRAGG